MKHHFNSSDTGGKIYCAAAPLLKADRRAKLQGLLGAGVGSGEETRLADNWNTLSTAATHTDH